MNEQRVKSSFSFYLQILILLAVFLSVGVVLVQVFAAARGMSRAARAETDGTTLCRSAAEAFGASGTAEATAALLGGTADGETVTCYYDAAIRAAAPDSAWTYRVTVNVSEEETAAGTIAAAHIEAYAADGTVCASLDTETYLPGTKGGTAYAA